MGYQKGCKFHLWDHHCTKYHNNQHDNTEHQTWQQQQLNKYPCIYPLALLWIHVHKNGIFVCFWLNAMLSCVTCIIMFCHISVLSPPFLLIPLLWLSLDHDEWQHPLTTKQAKHCRLGHIEKHSTKSASFVRGCLLSMKEGQEGRQALTKDGQAWMMDRSGVWRESGTQNKKNYFIL